MNQVQNSSLKPIIESNQGLHLTSYIENTGDINNLRKQIRDSIEVAHEFLSPVLTKEDLQKFLAPIEQLYIDAKMLKSFRNNIGAFRTPTSFRLINIPVDVEPICILATSFHVKPLLRWLQSDRDFLLLGIENNMVSLYRGNQNKFEHIDTEFLPALLCSKGDDVNDQKLNELTSWVNEWLLGIVNNEYLKLYIAGDMSLAKHLCAHLKYRQVHNTVISPYFKKELALNIATQIRLLIKNEAKAALERSLIEFKWAEDFNLAKKNIFQIARAAVQGKVRKLIIADGINIFGKLDHKTGGVSINPMDLDHEDDDLLDDLAQTVIRYGGEVIIAKREEIPKGRPILAILNSTKSEAEENKSSYIDLDTPLTRRTI